MVRSRLKSWSSFIVAVVTVVSFGGIVTPGVAGAVTPTVTTLGSSDNQGGAGFVRAVSCGTTLCAAVGDVTATDGSVAPFVSVNTAHGWHDALVPAVQGTGAGISCVSDSWCMAVGVSSQTGSAPIWVGMWNGLAWTFSTPTLAIGTAPNVTVTALSCGSASRCVLGGSFSDSAGLYQAFAATWNGSSWVLEVIGQSANTGGDGTITAVRCVATACYGVGSITTQQLSQQGFVAKISGSGSPTFTATATDITSATASTALALDCASATSCEVGGSFIDTSGGQQAFVGHYDGVKVVDQEIVGAENTGGYATVSAMQCPSPSTCVAVGSLVTSGGDAPGFAVVLNGTPVSAVPVTTGVAVATATQLNGMTCSSVQSCVAVGVVVDANSKQHPFVTNFDGTSWHAQEIFAANNPKGFGAATSVGCVVSGCVVGGFGSDQANHQQALVGVLAYQSQAALVLHAVASATAGTSVVVRVSGGSGALAPVLSVSGVGCLLVGNTVATTQSGSCSVLASNPGSGWFGPTTATTVITFTARVQAAFQLFAPRTVLRVGTSETIAPRGGSGVGIVRYAVSGPHCLLQGLRVVAKSPGTCTIVATKAGAGLYGPTTSAPLRITVRK